MHVYQDGSVHLNHGGTEMGQGLFRKVSQVAAQRFGLPVERVKITATDTAKVPNTSATAASSGSDLNGMAVKAACDTIRDRIAGLIAERHQARASEVRFEDGQVIIGGERYGWQDAVRLAYENRVSLSATGFYKTPKVEWDRIAGRGRPFFYFAQGVAASEVVIDTLTGENRILRTDILHDCGASLNPAIDIGQIEGGFVQGAGWLTTEELVWDDKGRLRTHAPSTYKIPACSDRPQVFNVALWDGRNREDTIYRSKAVGRAAADARHLGAAGAVGCLRRMRPALSSARRPRDGRTRPARRRTGPGRMMPAMNGHPAMRAVASASFGVTEALR